MNSVVTRARNYLRVVETRAAIPELDGLRAIAIVLVLARHGIRPFYHQTEGFLPIGSWDCAIPLLNGWAGVDLFFVLSGFLVTHHLLHRWPKQFDRFFVYRYWSKRVCRTFPAYYAMLLIVSLNLIPYYVPYTTDVLADIPAHLVFLQDYTGAQIVVAFWSLGVEEKFYLVAPFIILLLLNMPQSRLRYQFLLGLTLVPLVLRAVTYKMALPINNYADFFWTLRSPFHLILDGFWMGTICAFVYRAQCVQPEAFWRNQRVTRSLLCFGVVLVSLLLFSEQLLVSGDWEYSIIVLALLPLGFSAILLSVVLNPQPVCFLGSSICAFFSKISYSLYLVHLTFIPGIFILLQTLCAFDTYSRVTQFLIFFPVFVCVSVLGALLLHYLVEKPFLLLKDRIRV